MKMMKVLNLVFNAFDKIAKAKGRKTSRRRGADRRSLRLESLESRQLLAIAVAGGAETEPNLGTSDVTGALEGDIIPASEDVSLLAIELDAPTPVWTASTDSSITIDWNDVENAESYDLQWKFTDADWSEAEISVAEDLTATEFLLDDLADGTTVYFRVAAKSVSEGSESAWSDDLIASSFTGEVAWDLSEYDYTEYVIDSGTNAGGAGVWASLYGVSGGSQTLLTTTIALGSDSTLQVAGDTSKDESITITGDAMVNLPNFVYDGGSDKDDTITIEGNATNDLYSIASITVETEVETNSDCGKSDWGWKDRGWNDWGWDDWGWGGRQNDNGRNATKTVSTEWATINYSWTLDSDDGANGASLQLNGVKTVSIDALGGDDTFSITTLATDFLLTDSDETDGTNVLDFSNAAFDGDSRCRDDWGWNGWGWSCWDWNCWSWGGWGWDDWGGGRSQKINGVTVNLDSTGWQTISKNWSGQLQLDGDFKELVGSSQNDKITGSNVTVTQTSGANTVELTGGENLVTLEGDKNTVKATGAGTNTITVSGNQSKVDLSRAESDSVNTVTVTGDRNTVRGSAAADTIALSGERNSAKAGSGDDQITVGGGNSRIDGGDGNDVIWAVNTTGRNSFSGGSGNDIVFGGSGNDRIDGGNGRDVLVGSTGADAIFGRDDSDIMIANRTAALEDMENWNDETRNAFLDEVYQSWAIDEDMDATIELLGESSIADSAKDRLRRGHGSDYLFYMNSSDGDRGNARTSDPWNDRVFDGV